MSRKHHYVHLRSENNPHQSTSAKWGLVLQWAFSEPDQSLLSELRSCRWTFDFWVSKRKQDEHKQMLPGNDGAVCATAAQTETRSFEMHGVGALSPRDAFWIKRRRKCRRAASDAHLWGHVSQRSTEQQQWTAEALSEHQQIWEVSYKQEEWVWEVCCVSKVALQDERLLLSFNVS